MNFIDFNSMNLRVIKSQNVWYIKNIQKRATLLCTSVGEM